MQLRTLVQWCVGIALATAVVASAEIPESTPVKLAPMTVIERPITNLVCSVRFRYHLPGAGMKDLVVSKVPAWCAAQGIKAGDRIVAVDGKRINGQGLAAFVKGLLIAKFDPAKGQPVHFRLAVQSPKETKSRDIEVVFDDARHFTVKYP